MGPRAHGMRGSPTLPFAEGSGAGSSILPLLETSSGAAVETWPLLGFLGTALMSSPGSAQPLPSLWIRERLWWVL